MSLMEEFFAECAANDPCFLNTVFVFPSQIPADLWMTQLLRMDICPTVSSDSFISWDTFKETAIKNRVAGLQPVSAVIRRMYTQNIARQNSAAGTPLFTGLIPQQFAEQSAIFADWLAKLLPQLGIWIRYRAKNGATPQSAEDRDMEKLYRLYSVFLKSYNLFEPSWELPPLPESGKKFYLLFPQTIDDFAEYEYLIAGSPSVTVKNFNITQTPGLCLYTDIRQEISDVTAQIRRLALDEHVPLSDIAISVPDIENTAPYLLRELALYDIPFRYRAGTALSATPGGQMFSLINACVTSRFSFESVKALLLNRQIPWKNRAAGQLIIERGIEFHCVTSWKENGEYVDIWESALKAAAVNPNDADIHSWFKGLCRVLESLVAADSFSAIRRRYFEFRNTYLDILLFTEEDNLIVSRCIEELTSLIEKENDFPDIMPANPYDFFISHLQNKKYVSRTGENGVSIFPYKVAAGIPAAYHFVIDISQEDTTVTYGALQFLRTDQRKALNVPADTDVSANFFDAYCAGCGKALYFSCSQRTITGYRTPHGHFAARTNQCFFTPGLDSVNRESAFFYYKKDQSSADTPPIPPVMFASRKQSFAAWKARQGGTKRDAAQEPLTACEKDLAPYFAGDRITSDGDIRISATQMNKFFTCPLQWYYGTLLNLKEFSLDAGLIDAKNLGSIIHRALEYLFTRIKKETPGGCFQAALLDTYKTWVPECVQLAFNNQKEFNGPLAKPMLEPMTTKAESSLLSLLENEKKLDGLFVTALEQRLQIRGNGMLLTGIIDRISTAADGESVIFDYKTGTVPPLADSTADINSVLKDYQIAMYVYLAENSDESPLKNTAVENAAFYKITPDMRGVNPFATVMAGTILKGSLKTASREVFNTTLEIFLRDTMRMKTAIQHRDFTIQDNPAYDDCSACPFKMVCRQLYAVK